RALERAATAPSHREAPEPLVDPRPLLLRIEREASLEALGQHERADRLLAPLPAAHRGGNRDPTLVVDRVGFRTEKGGHARISFRHWAPFSTTFTHFSPPAHHRFARRRCQNKTFPIPEKSALPACTDVHGARA